MSEQKKGPAQPVSVPSRDKGINKGIPAAVDQSPKPNPVTTVPATKDSTPKPPPKINRIVFRVLT